MIQLEDIVHISDLMKCLRNCAETGLGPDPVKGLVLVDCMDKPQFKHIIQWFDGELTLHTENYYGEEEEN